MTRVTFLVQEQTLLQTFEGDTRMPASRDSLSSSYQFLEQHSDTPVINAENTRQLLQQERSIKLSCRPQQQAKTILLVQR